MKIYLASPIISMKKPKQLKYSSEKMSRNKIIAEKLIKNGFDVFLPQENQKSTAKLTLENELQQIKKCDILIAVLSDTKGVYLETGYAKGIGKKIYGLQVEETGPVSEWLNNFFDYIAKNTEDLIQYLK